MARFRFEGTVQQTVIVIIEAKDEAAAKARAEKGDFDEVEESLKPDLQGWEWNGDDDDEDDDAGCGCGKNCDRWPGDPCPLPDEED